MITRYMQKNVKKRFPLKIDESNTSEKFIATTAIFTIESPLYKPENLLNYVASWLKDQNGWKIKRINPAEHLIDCGRNYKCCYTSSFLFCL